MLRMEETRLIRRWIVQERDMLDSLKGTVFEDAPQHGSIEELVDLAQDRESWTIMVNALNPRKFKV